MLFNLEKRDFRKVICGIIYSLIVIFVAKLATISYEGTRVTITSKLSSNIIQMRISNLSKVYDITTKNSKEENSLYVEKIYNKKIVEESSNIKLKNTNIYVQNKVLKENLNKDSTKRINASEISFPKYGSIMARINIPSCNINTNVMCGLTQEIIDKYDVAMQEALTSVYVDPMLPGFGRPMLMAGHNYKSFSRLSKISVGSTINITTNYGSFYYTVTEAKVAKLNVHGTTIVDIDTGKDLIVYSGKEQLQIYTCDSINPNDNKRFFVRAIKTAGTEVIF